MFDLTYEEVYQLSIVDPGKFWEIPAKDVIWNKPFSMVLEDKESIFPKWFVDGEINMCYNCLDRQVEEGFGEEIAVIYDSPWRKIVEKITYQQLLESVKLLSGVLVDKCGVRKGDRVLFYMPTIPQCLVGMLACTRIGANHTVINAGFGYKEITMRINHFEPKVVITTNGGSSPNGFVDFKSKVDSAMELSDFSPDFCIVYNLPEFDKAKIIKAKDLDWEEEISRARPKDPIYVESNHPMCINYTSGTTGDPKGLVLDTGPSTVSLKYYLKAVYDMKPGETFFAMSSFSWILGGTVVAFGALMSRNPTVIYEGKPSDRNDVLELIRLLNEHEVVALTCTPTVMRIIMKYAEIEDLQLTHKKLKMIGLTGEMYSAFLRNWISETFHCPVYSIWGQTELGSILMSGFLGYKRSTPQTSKYTKSVLMPGVIGKILNRETKQEVPDGTVGRFVLKLPLNPVRASTMFKSEKRFYEVYFQEYPGYYDTMDSAVMKNGYIKILSRDDNIIHVASTRINGYAVEEACLIDKNLERVAIVALEDPIKGFVPFGFFVLRRNCKVDKKETIKTAIKNVMDNVGELACFDQAVFVPDLPIGKSGKTLRSSLELLINGKEFKVPIAIENPEMYPVIHKILCEAGYKPKLPT